MAKSYRARNKRIIPRSGDGKFRKTVLSDIGAGVCQGCGKLFGWSEPEKVGAFVDPFAIAKAKSYCQECLSEQEQK